ncbi:MAG: sugar nucleotide-binding protein [Bacteroidota bacterium]
MNKRKILILGASGASGYTIYKELCNYFDTYGTYCYNTAFANNGQFLNYDVNEDDIFQILDAIRPEVVISAIRGDFSAQVQAHLHLMEYLAKNDCRLYFLSSANVFDAYSKYPSYEYDKTLSESIYGKLKIRIENMMLRMPPEKTCILRVPMVFGNTSPRIKEIKAQLQAKEAIEVFPNLIMNVITDDRLTQQVHYLINRNKTGIYHLGSQDLVHHEDFIKEVIKKIGNYHPVLKKVYTTNHERYLAALPKHNTFPKNLRFSYQEVIDHHLSVE